jgi:hypothetical protein
VRRFVLFAVTAAAVAALARPAAADEIDKELAEAAKQLKQFLAGRAATEVHVGAIRSKSEESISHGPGLGRRLAAQLAAVGVRVSPDARYGVAGEYAQKDDERSKRVVIQLDLSVVDRQRGNARLATFPRGLFGEAALVELLAPSAIAIPAELKTREAREEFVVKKIDDLRDRPTAVIDGTVMYPDAVKAYGLELAVKGPGGAYVPRTPRYVDGDFVVELRKDDVFAVRLRNNTKHEAGAMVLIDGLDTFSFGAFEKVEKKPRWLVPGGQAAEVVGWPFGPGKSYEFLVTSYGDSAAAKLGGDQAKNGVLTVLFAASWLKNGSPPTDEAGARNAPLGVGFGKERNTPLNQVERMFGQTRAVISVRYAKN